MAVTTLLDIAKANGHDAIAGIIEEVQRAHPEVQMVPMRPIKGINYKTLVRTTLPTVAFRSANEGAAATKSTFEERLIEAFILNPRWECDVAVADAYEDGAAAWIALEAAAQLEASMILLGSTFYYGRGTGGDAKGNPGLVDSVHSTMVYDATGTTANTGSSCWGVRVGVQQTIWVAGNNGNLQMEDVAKIPVTDGSGNKYTAYMQEILCRIGLQVGSKYACGRIKNLTADSGKGLTDAKISELLALFPVGQKPEFLLCSRRSLKQLQQSRTATNVTGAPAPIPTESFGIPIHPTDSILDTEAIA